jgi:hypothetical protein
LFFSKITSQTKTSNFLLIPLNWCSNTCCIYQQVVFLGWFLNIFETIFILKIQQMNSFNCSNFVSYCTRSHSTTNYTCPWGGPPLNHDQSFRWSSFHCNRGNIISTHKPHFMSSIPRDFCNTFFSTLIWSYN